MFPRIFILTFWARKPLLLCPIILGSRVSQAAKTDAVHLHQTSSLRLCKAPNWLTKSFLLASVSPLGRHSKVGSVSKNVTFCVSVLQLQRFHQCITFVILSQSVNLRTLLSFIHIIQFFKNVGHIGQFLNEVFIVIQICIIIIITLITII